MEEYYNVKRLALVLAVQAEIEGMKAVNAQDVHDGCNLSYLDRQFKDKAEELRSLAYAHNEQL
jgi:hypothetical protein